MAFLALAHLKFASGIIAKSTRERPADLVLKHELKAAKGLLREDSSRITQAVFTYYRWFGWLNRKQSVTAQIEEASELAERFAERPDTFTDEELVERAVPAWSREQFEVTAELARALQSEPRLWLRARAGRGRELARELGSCFPFGEDGPRADILRYAGREDLFKTEAFQHGEFELQDITSQAVGLICAPSAGEMWWDACAGEGGKTLHLSDLMGNKGLIWASDRAEWRLKKLRLRAARARVFNFRAALWNGEAKLPTKTRFNGVLVDAPCSGAGTWQRNPHARWTSRIEDVQELGAIQKQLLGHAAAGVKPGGRLIYSVCTLMRAETHEVVKDFDERFAEFERTRLVNPLEPGSATAEWLELLPQKYGGNGMFVAAWSRKASAT